MIFQSLIKKIEQGCGIDRYIPFAKIWSKCGKKGYYCPSCSAQLSLLKTLQKEVEEVLDVLGKDDNEMHIKECLKSSLENVGVKE